MTRVRKRAAARTAEESNAHWAAVRAGGGVAAPEREALTFTRHVDLEAAHEDFFRTSVRKKLGGLVFKITGVKGIPDRMVLLPGGRIELVELKTTTGAPSPIQRLWHAKAAALGVIVTVLHGRDEITAWVEARRE